MAISVSEILGQDSPNSGRLKVNTNFDTIVSEVNIANLPRHSYKAGGRDCFTNAVNLVWHKAKSAVYWRTPSQR